jgi:uroporphyrin-III C-methyltransferase / precorrin-2 dehydrogenase / sirohydrochlorin ferrochelatase
MRALLPTPKPTPPHMAALARLPVFLSLKGKRVLVVGGTAAAAWKVELLSAAGADVHVVTTFVSDELAEIAAQPALDRQRVSIQRRGWASEDLANVSLAVGTFEDDREAARFANAAEALQIPFNVVDNPTFSSFTFGAIVNRSPLVIGISTDGAAPAFAQAIRTKIETLLPVGFARWADAARAWRDRVKRSALSFAGRRRFWQRFAVRATNNPNATPNDGDFDQLLTDAQRESGPVERGSIALVGTGPGDPELVTLRAARLLRSADAILFDERVSPDILDFARREARKMLVGQVCGDRSRRQDETSRLALTLAHAGKRVVRLTVGDPATSDSGKSEFAAYQAAGVVVELVPGIVGAAENMVALKDSKQREPFTTDTALDQALPGA